VNAREGPRGKKLIKKYQPPKEFNPFFGGIGECVNDTEIDIPAQMPGRNTGSDGFVVQLHFESDELCIFWSTRDKEFEQRWSTTDPRSDKPEELDARELMLRSFGLDYRPKDYSHLCMIVSLSKVRLLPRGIVNFDNIGNFQLIFQVMNGVRPKLYIEPVNPLEKKFDWDAVKHTWIQLAKTESVSAAYPSLAVFIKLLSSCNLLYFDGIRQREELESFMEAKPLEKTYIARNVRSYEHEGYSEAKQKLSFSVLWELQRLISCGTITKPQISRDFVDLILSYSEDDAVRMLRSDWPMFGSDLVRVFKEREQMTYNYFWRRPEETTIRSLTITPTGKRFDQSTSLSASNRVVRQFQRHSDYFLIVKFRDENPSETLNSPISDYVIERVKNKLSRGIKVGHRRYEFLAYSGSQLRDHSCWFFATPPSDPNCTVEAIRKWMGSFEGIKNPAKYAARLGQCFSVTHRSVELDAKRVVIEDDITYDGHIFSDGIGRISPSLAAKLNTSQEMPSAFQVLNNNNLITGLTEETYSQYSCNSDSCWWV